MSELRVSLKITGDGKVAVEAVKQVTGALQQADRAADASAPSQDRLKQKTDQSAQSMGGLVNAVRGYVALSSAKAVLAEADAYALRNARLQLATGTQERFTAAQLATFAIAQRAQAELGSVTSLYGKIQGAVDQLGGSQEQALRVTETVAQAFRVSGASAAESAGAIMQLAQGLNAGALRGDEFNSVIEQAPRIQQLLADALGVNKGELRKLADQGKLTSETLIAAFEAQGGKIAAEAQRIPNTVGGAFTQLQNSLSVVIGKVLGGTGGMIADTVALIAEYAQYLPEAFDLGVTQIIAFFDRMQIGAREKVSLLVNGAIVGWTVIQRGASELGVQIQSIFAYALDAAQRKFADFAGSIGEFATSVGLEGLGTSLSEFDRALRNGADREAQLRVEAAATNAEYDRRLKALQDNAEGITAEADAARQASADAVDASQRQLDLAMQLGSSYRGVAAEVDSAAASTVQLGAATEATGKKAAQAQKQINDAARSAADSLQSRVRELSGQLQGPLVQAGNALAASMRQIAEEEAKLAAAGKLDEEQQARVALARQQTTVVYQRQVAEVQRGQRAVDQYLASQREDVRLAGLSADAREKEQTRMRAVAEARRAIAEAQSAGRTFTEAEIKAIERTAVALEEQRTALQEAATQRTEFQNIALRGLDGVGRAFGDLVASGGKSIKDFFRSAKDLFKQGIADLVSTAFRQRIVIPIQAQMQQGAGLFSAIGSLFGGGGSGAGGGGILSMIGSLFGGGSGTGAGGGGILGALGSLFGGSGGGAGFNVGSAGGPYGALFNFANRAIPTTGVSAGLFGSNAGGFGSMAGNALGAVGGAFGVYQAYRSGSPLSGAASGAALGTAVLPGIGTIIGGIVGALAGLLGGPKPPDVRVGGIGFTRKAEVDFQTVFGAQSIGVRGGLDEREFISTIQQFDASIASLIGESSTQMAAISARLATWSVDLKGAAATAEGVLGSRFDAILSTFETSVQSYVGSAGTLAERTQRLADGLFIAKAAVSGELLTEFQALATLLRENAAAGEAVNATYARLVLSTQLWEEATRIAGQTFDGTRTQLITFASSVVEALGGIEQASSILEANLGAFYTEAERRAAALAAARAEVARLGTAAQLGDQPLASSDFRSLLDRAIAGEFDADHTASILAYGAALARLNALAAENGPGNAADNQERDREQRLQASQDYAEQVAALRAELAEQQTMSLLQQLDAIGEAAGQQVRSLNDLARAAGFSSAATADLVLVQTRAARQYRAAYEAVERATIDLVGQLYPAVQAARREVGSELDLLGRMRAGTLVDQDPQRFSQATTVAGNVRQLAEASGRDVFSILEQLRVPLSAFAADLGAAGGSAGAIDNMVAAARLLGAELPDFANRLGLSVGELADSNSVVNDAFERLLGQLTGNDRTTVEGLLRQLETSTAPEAQAALRSQLGEAINALPTSLRSLFAPLLDDVDTTSAEDLQVEALGNLVTLGDSQVRLLGTIAGLLGGPRIVEPGQSPNITPAKALTDPAVQAIQQAGATAHGDFEALRREISDLRRGVDRLLDRIATGALP